MAIQGIKYKVEVSSKNKDMQKQAGISDDMLMNVGLSADKQTVEKYQGIMLNAVLDSIGPNMSKLAKATEITEETLVKAISNNVAGFNPFATTGFSSIFKRKFVAERGVDLWTVGMKTVIDSDDVESVEI